MIGWCQHWFGEYELRNFSVGDSTHTLYSWYTAVGYNTVVTMRRNYSLIITSFKLLIWIYAWIASHWQLFMANKKCARLLIHILLMFKPGFECKQISYFHSAGVAVLFFLKRSGQPVGNLVYHAANPNMFTKEMGICAIMYIYT